MFSLRDRVHIMSIHRSPTLEGNHLLRSFVRFSFILPATATVICIMLAGVHFSNVEQVDCHDLDVVTTELPIPQFNRRFYTPTAAPIPDTREPVR